MDTTDNSAYAKILTYIDDNPLAIVSTLNLDGSPHGAAVYVCSDDRRHAVYFLTKTETQKYKNLIARDRVCVTIVNHSKSSTLQADGRAFVVNDANTIEMVTNKIAQAQTTASDWVPPIAKLRAGAYVIIRVDIWHARLAEFMNMEIGDEHIFTQA